MLIDLRKLREPLTKKMRKALVSFSKKHPDEQICTVAIWGDGFHGTAALWLNTPDSSAASVKANLDHGFAWYGEDRQGRFCNSPCDFYYSLGEFNFPRYPDFYRVEDDVPVDFITLEGTKERADLEEGDERKNQIVFPFLKAVVTDLQPFAELSRVAPDKPPTDAINARAKGIASVHQDCCGQSAQESLETAASGEWRSPHPRVCASGFFGFPPLPYCCHSAQ